MKSMVVFFALASVACGSLLPLAQPAHHPALVLDPHGRPLDTAEVINARAIHLQAKALEGHGALLHAAPVAVAPVAHGLVAPAVVAAPTAVSHQSRVDIRTSPAIVTAHAAPVLSAHTYAAPLLGHSTLGFAGHGHLLKKRSLAHLTYAAPVLAHAAPVYAAPAAVSHQSRVDVVSSPAIVSNAVAAPVLAHAAAPVVAHAIAPAAVSHQSRVDVRTSPAIVSHSVLATPVLSVHSAYGHTGYGHLLKKRSLGYAVAPIAIAHAPAAVSHQSRVDVVSSPAVVSHSVVAPVIARTVVSHAAPIVPLAHSAVFAVPVSHSVHSAPLGYAGHW